MVGFKRFLFLSVFLGIMGSLYAPKVPSLIQLTATAIGSDIQKRAEKVLQGKEDFSQENARIQAYYGKSIPSELKDAVIKEAPLKPLDQILNFKGPVEAISAANNVLGVVLKDGQTYVVPNTQLAFEPQLLPKHSHSTDIAVQVKPSFLAGKEDIQLTTSSAGIIRDSSFSTLINSPMKTVVSPHQPIENIKAVGKRLFATTPDKTYAIETDEPAPKRVKQIATQEYSHIAISPDEQISAQWFLASKAGNPSVMQFKKNEDNTLLGTLALSSEQGKITRLDFSPDSKNIIMGTDKGKMLCYDIEKGLLTSLPCGPRGGLSHGHMITGLYASPAKKGIYSASRGKLIRTDIQGKAATVLSNKGDIAGIFPSEDNQWMAAAGHGAIQVFHKDERGDYKPHSTLPQGYYPEHVVFNNNPQAPQITVAAGNQVTNWHYPSSYIQIVPDIFSSLVAQKFKENKENISNVERKALFEALPPVAQAHFGPILNPHH
jgi:hypothetical protein